MIQTLYFSSVTIYTNLFFYFLMFGYMTLLDSLMSTWNKLNLSEKRELQ